MKREDIVKKNQKFWLSLVVIVIIIILVAFFLRNSLNGWFQSENTNQQEVVTSQSHIVFNADSAFLFCQQQCDFGPRVMNSTAHDECAEYIINKFKGYGLQVIEQDAMLTGYDNTQLKSKNIIASLNPDKSERVLICAHWDSRPWADNDPLPENHKKPIMAANDGASGVAVMLELARILQYETTVGIDFICFDAEDYGVPQWENKEAADDSWALGSQYWANHPHKNGYQAEYGILLDMVGGKGARFYRESFSDYYASAVVDKVWITASQIGYGNYFINSQSGKVTDDHKPINEVLHIPTIDIIGYYPDCQLSSFGPTWHTVSDTVENLDVDVLQAVGATLCQLLTN